MEIWKKISALLLCVAMVATLLSGCGAAKVDPIQEAFGYSKDTVFATIDGDKITAEDYLPWLANYTSYIDNMYKSMGMEGLNWDEDMGDGVKARDFMKSEILDSVKILWTIEKIAKEEGVKLSAEDKKLSAENLAKAVETSGGQEAYDAYLKSMCLTQASMQRITNMEALTGKLEEALCREGGKFDATKDTVHAYMDEQGILKAKHILLLTKDPAVDGKTYSAAKIAEQKKKADDLLAQLRAAEDPITLFDTLMNANSEDSGLKGNPDGYLFSTKPDGKDFTSRMVPQFEEGTAALEYNKISEVVKSDFGYHIILRLDPLADEATFKKYQEKWYGVQMDKLYQERMDAMEVKTTEAYDKLDAKDFYDKLLVYRQTVEAALPPKEEAKPEGETAAPKEGDGAAPAGDAPKDATQTDGAATTGDTSTQPEGTQDGSTTQTPAG